LEVIEILEEPMKIAGLFQFGVASLEHGCQHLPRSSQLGDAFENNLGFFRVAILDLISLGFEGLELGLDGGQVSFHARQFPLESHDAGQVHLEFVRLFQNSHLVFDPGDRLSALDVEGLDSVSAAEFLSLVLGLLPELAPLLVEIVLPGDDLLRVGVLDMKQLTRKL
jgi:hypothetical protein